MATTKRKILAAFALSSVIIMSGDRVASATREPPAAALYSFDCNTGAGRLVALQNRRTRLDDQIASDNSRVDLLLAHPKKGTTTKANSITRQITSIAVRVELIQARIDQLQTNIHSLC